MTLRLDHIIITVEQLEQAVKTFTDLGFTVTPGGEHTNGLTHNALVIFRDGTYLELLAPTGKPKVEGVTAPDFSKFLTEGPGLTGYALHSDNLQEERVMQGENAQIGHLLTGGRVRPDGTRLSWWIGFIEGRLSPFYIQDRTPRELRVPNSAQFTVHPNGIEGISGVVILVSDLQAVMRHYWDMTGVMFIPEGDYAEFSLKKHHFQLREAQTGEQRNYLEPREEALYRIDLNGERTLYAFRDGRVVLE